MMPRAHWLGMGALAGSCWPTRQFAELFRAEKRVLASLTDLDRS